MSGSKKCKLGCTCRRHAVYYTGGRPGLRREPLGPDELKTCTKCSETKPITEFNLSRRATETRNAVFRPWCKTCQGEIAKKWFEENPDRQLASKRRHNWRSYGMTPEKYNQMLAEQGGVCAICGQDEPAANGRTGKKFLLSVDHDHATGEVRGLLCNRCNRAIGLMSDSTDLLKKAIYYLQERA